jgi:uncharacterized membrane protein YcaP (DUF421 family)
VNYIWEALVILPFGFLLMRLAGKKTVAQMTGIELITILSIASTTGHALSESGLLKTAITLGVLTGVLLTAQYLSIKSERVENLLIGKATVVIENGRIIPEHLKKLRMSVDQLEARLRMNGISSFSDVKTGTIEMNGEFGYELMPAARPMTLKDWEQMLKAGQPFPSPADAHSGGKQGNTGNLFQEVKQGGNTEENAGGKLQ